MADPRGYAGQHSANARQAYRQRRPQQPPPQQPQQPPRRGGGALRASLLVLALLVVALVALYCADCAVSAQADEASQGEALHTLRYEAVVGTDDGGRVAARAFVNAAVLTSAGFEQGVASGGRFAESSRLVFAAFPASGCALGAWQVFETVGGERVDISDDGRVQSFEVASGRALLEVTGARGDIEVGIGASGEAVAPAVHGGWGVRRADTAAELSTTSWNDVEDSPLTLFKDNAAVDGIELMWFGRAGADGLASLDAATAATLGGKVFSRLSAAGGFASMELRDIAYGDHIMMAVAYGAGGYELKTLRMHRTAPLPTRTGDVVWVQRPAGVFTCEVTDADARTVRLISASVKKGSSVTVNKVDIDGNPYRVVAIGAGAFRGCGLKKLTLGANVGRIGAQAFAGCKQLKEIVLKSTQFKKKTVKKSLKGSKVKTLNVKVGAKPLIKQYVKKYKKVFAKKVSGRKVTVL